MKQREQIAGYMLNLKRQTSSPRRGPASALSIPTDRVIIYALQSRWTELDKKIEFKHLAAKTPNQYLLRN